MEYKVISYEVLKDTKPVSFCFRVSLHLQHGFSLSSVYSHYVPDTGVPEVTTCHSRSAITVDYIFYTAEKDDSARGPGRERVETMLERTGPD